jgi:hypothetical protein
MHWIWPKKTIEDLEITIAVRFGRFIHWAAVAFAGILWLGEFVGIIFGYWSNNSFIIGMVLLAGLAILLIGRGLRYVFANE